jgi:DNA-directed RNA polymerase subunit M/transcription elongation factor TFIIS
MTKPVTPPTDDREVAYIYASKPRCPDCGAAELKAYRSRRDAGDGATIRWVKCSACGARAVLILE